MRTSSRIGLIAAAVFGITGAVIAQQSQAQSSCHDPNVQQAVLQRVMERIPQNNWEALRRYGNVMSQIVNMDPSISPEKRRQLEAIFGSAPAPLKLDGVSTISVASNLYTCRAQVSDGRSGSSDVTYIVIISDDGTKFSVDVF